MHLGHSFKSGKIKNRPPRQWSNRTIHQEYDGRLGMGRQKYKQTVGGSLIAASLFLRV